MSENQSIIKEFIKTILNCDLESLLKDEMYVESRNIFITKVKKFLVSDEIRSMLYKGVEDKINQIEKEEKSLKDVLPRGFENSLKVLVYNKGPEIMCFIKEFINDEKFKDKVKVEINKFMKSVNPMVSKFVNADSINNKIFTSLSSYFDDSENMMIIVMEINKKIDEVSNKSVSEITRYIPYEGKIAFIRGFVDKLVDFIMEEAYTKNLVNKFEKAIAKYGTVGKLMNDIGITEEKIFNKL